MAERYNPSRSQALFDLAFGQDVQPNVPEYAKPFMSPFSGPDIAIMRAVIDAMRRQTDSQLNQLNVVQHERDEFDDLIGRKISRGRRKQANLKTMPTIPESLRLPTPEFPFPGGVPQPSPDRNAVPEWYRPGTLDAQRLLMHPSVWKNTPIMEKEWHPYTGEFKPPVNRSRM